MVKIGHFTVELVSADTKAAFKEHTSASGQVYAEVEPDVEYFIRVRSDAGLGVQIDGLSVDGVQLNYHYNLQNLANPEALLGKWERKNHVCKMTALRFIPAQVGAAPVKAGALTGRVEASFYTVGDMYYEPYCDYASNELTGCSALGGKKCVASKSGTVVTDRQALTIVNGLITKYARGSYLSTITLNYCTAAGLIANGILPQPPPSPEPAGGVINRALKKENKRTRSESRASTVSSVEKRARGETVTVTIQKSYELVDLTGDV